MPAIEVILKQPVPGLGAEADLVRVKAGYARNYLIPQQIAVNATSASKRQIEELKKKRAEREAEELNVAQELSTKLGKMTLTFQMQTSGRPVEGQAKVFGSVTAQDIVDRLKEQGVELEKKKLGLAHPLKALGETVLTVQLGHGVQGKLKIVLEAPKAEEAADNEGAPKKKGAKASRTAKKTKEAEA
jgi:large subunit ribosomal protein L9